MFWQGLLMGLADSVPGISGGTVAFILRIHARLVAAIAGLDRGWLKALWTRDVETLKQRDTLFLVFLTLGIGIGIVVGAKLLADILLPAYPGIMMALLFGLVAYSIRLPARRVPWDLKTGSLTLLATVAAFSITVVSGATAPDAWWFLPIAGSIAACAMILPGISGAYLLLLMGLYEPILGAISHFDLTVVALVGLGAIIGLLLFSRGLHWLLQHRSPGTHAVLVGLLAGSVLRLWPWRTEAGFAHGAPTFSGDAWLAVPLIIGVALAWALDRAVQKPKGT